METEIYIPIYSDDELKTMSMDDLQELGGIYNEASLQILEQSNKVLVLGQAHLERLLRGKMH